jgi:hypothetical protein
LLEQKQMNLSSKVNRLVGYWTINKLLSTEDKFGYFQPFNICSEDVRIFITQSNNWTFSNRGRDILGDYIYEFEF